MRILAVLSLFVFCAAALRPAHKPSHFGYKPQRKANPFALSGHALVNHINKVGRWKAQFNTGLDARPDHEKRRLAGVKADFPQVFLGDVRKQPKLLAKVQKDASEAVPLPRSFDARQKWPKCAGVIDTIQDQSLCGSCWIVSSASAFSDRLCIYTGGKHKPQISATDALACCKNCGEGCVGGYPHRAFQYMQSQGIVSGGNFTEQTGCKPYAFPPCRPGKSTRQEAISQCDGGVFKTPACVRTCRQGFNYNYWTDRYFAASTAGFQRDAEAIQRELFTYGPLVFSALQVYEDFLHYKSGVYEVTGGRFIGLHAIRVVGWGETDDGVPYWIVANSWGRQWGDKGFFKIRRGKNEANIEGTANSAYPDVSRSTKAFTHL